MTSAVDIDDFTNPEVLSSHTHDFFRKYRDSEPIKKIVDEYGREIYLVLQYGLIEQISRQPEIFSSDCQHLLMAGTGSSGVADILAQAPIRGTALVNVDDPAHKRMRALVNIVFATGRISRLAPALEVIADELIDTFIERGECDFVNEFAAQFPTFVIADILGLAREDAPRVREWSDAVIRMAGRVNKGEAELADARTIVDLRRFILEMVQKRRAQPGDDLITNLINARVEGYEPLTDAEIGPLALEVAVAGNETTRNVMTSGLMRLIRNPDQLQKLIDDPSLITNAVEECLRYEPATSLWRTTTREIEIGRLTLPKGANILLRYDSANRDPRKFEQPEDFDVQRKNAHQHQAFGAAAIHRCLGQALARKEIQVAFAHILDRLNNMRIVEERSNMKYWPFIKNRGIQALYIAFDPGQRIYTDGGDTLKSAVDAAFFERRTDAA